MEKEKRDLVLAVAGLGYVGLSLAVLLSQHHKVYAVDVDPRRVEELAQGHSPISDRELEHYLKDRPLQLQATLDARQAYEQADVVIVAVPTDYDETHHQFDTSHVDEVLTLIEQVHPEALVVIKSTIPVGYTKAAAQRYQKLHLLFSPEFLREGRALYDNLYPSRIIVGIGSQGPDMETEAQLFAQLLKEGAEKEDVPIKIMDSSEAEAVKLFANTYLALRVAYFNELDTYACVKGMDTKSIIDGVCLDPRIGGHYNNPSFGYGGYCLPKDTKELKADYGGVPEALMDAVIRSNEIRKAFIAQQVLETARSAANSDAARPVIGIYRLIMKSGSDNFRQSAIQTIMDLLKKEGAQLLIYEPTLEEGSLFGGGRVTRDLPYFKETSQVIVANRMDSAPKDAAHKVYTRDLFGRD